MLLDNEIKIYS